MTTATFGNNTTDTFTGSADSELNSGSPTANLSTSGAFEINNGGTPNTGVLKFTALATALAGSAPVTVSACTLKLFLTQQGSTAHISMAIRRLLLAFVEDEVTWNNRLSAVAWNTAGARGDGTDRVATAIGTGAIDETVNQYYLITIDPAYAEGVINGTLTDNGMHLDITTAGEWKKFATKEGTDGQRPLLEVVYSAAPPPPVSNVVPRRSMKVWGYSR